MALSLGLDGAARPLTAAAAAGIEAAAAARWREALGDVRLTGPAAARPAFDTLRTALAHILATREGPALRPGSRSYARAWIRDGAMMSDGAAAHGPRPAGDRLPRILRALPISERQGALLRRCARRRSGARA